MDMSKLKEIIKIKFLMFPLLLLLLLGCVKNNPLPAYLSIDELTLQANPVLNGREGDLFHGIKHVAVYVGGDILGYFELPCKIPILEFGQQRITISPAIMDGGRMNVKIVYPFLDYYYEDLNVESGKTYQIHPVTKYNDNVQFAFVEDFESASLKIMSDPTSSASLSQEQYVNTPGKSGYMGVVHLNAAASDTLWIGNSFSDLVLPKGGKPVYMEVDYHTPVNVSTGIISINSQNINTINPNVRINGQEAGEGWKKIYIDLTEIVSYTQDSQFFEIYLKSSLPSGVSSADVELDNIKILHF